MAGVTGTIAPSGELNAGNVSVSGQRETANGFLVNGGDVQEHMNGGTCVVPNLDSISEFRVLTNNFDPQYGNYNGGIVNVVTKSGSDSFHGNVFEFLRNTSLDSRNFFASERAAFRQNQSGGTFGGPIKKDKVFFFRRLSGTRTTQGVDTGLISVPTLAQRNGDFSADPSDFIGSKVNGSYWANLLSQRLGYAVTPGEPYYTAGCTSSAQCVFPNGVIPQRPGPARATPLAVHTGTQFGRWSVLDLRVSEHRRGRQGSGRIDANTRLGFLSGYYFLDRYTRDDPYPGQQGGASVPGFDALTRRTGTTGLQWGQPRAFGTNTVNEFHFSVTRNANDVGRPHGGTGVSLASQGFVTGPGTPGIVVQAPQFEGVENIVFNSFRAGVARIEVSASRSDG